ncbi:MAG: hypothetical protein BGO69_05470 [Bacteroidetes bacterium 46-16]|nr:MAG: hypothetical protein BGO69_05470 [Bacteroidetes bacterium 46-16]
MRRATKSDRQLVVKILSQSFDKNPSVNHVIIQDHLRRKRIQLLMEYSFYVCLLFGEVFISDDSLACALVIYPDKKRPTLRSVLLNANLIFKCIGIRNIKKTLDREALLKKVRGKEKMSCLWFIGVAAEGQHKGTGSNLLQSVIANSTDKGRPVYLETSNEQNLPWYKKFGFNIYAEKDLGHTLYFLKRNIEK